MIEIPCQIDEVKDQSTTIDVAIEAERDAPKRKVFGVGFRLTSCGAPRGDVSVRDLLEACGRRCTLVIHDE